MVDIQLQNVDIKTCKESDLLEHGEKVFQAAAEAVELAKDVPGDILEMVIILYFI